MKTVDVKLHIDAESRYPHVQQVLPPPLSPISNCKTLMFGIFPGGAGYLRQQQRLADATALGVVVTVVDVLLCVVDISLFSTPSLFIVCADDSSAYEIYVHQRHSTASRAIIPQCNKGRDIIW